MKKHFLVIITSLILVALFISCNTRFGNIFYTNKSLGKRIDSITDYPVNLNSPNRVKAMIITDLQLGAKTGFIPKKAFYKSVEEKQPDMIFVLGDIAQHGHESEYQEYETFVNAIPLVNGQKIPIYCAVGNHDLYNSGWDLYQKYTSPGSTFFRLKTGNVSWYFVDSAGGTLGKKQLRILEKEMTHDPKFKFIFSHYPFYGDQSISYFALSNPRERAFLLNLCAKTNVLGIYSGHYHEGGSHDFGPFHEKVVNSLRSQYNPQQGWLMLDVDLANKSYIQEEYFWTGGDEYTTTSIKRDF